MPGAAGEEGKKLKVTLFLIKDDYKEIDDFLELGGNFYRLKVDAGDTTGELIYKGGFRSIPDWAEIFKDVDGFKKSEIVNQSCRGLYVIKFQNRFFCFTFGHARHLINQLAYERNFGLIVTLNVSDPASIRQIDKTNISHVALHSKEQATKNLAIGDFEFDYEIDILKSITAYVEKTDEDDGKETVSGRDSISIYTKIDLVALREIVKDLYAAYGSDKYKKRYPWIEYIQEERDKKIIQKLNSKLVEKIINKQFHDVWIAIPEVVEWQDIKGFANRKRNLVDDRSGPVLRADLDIEAWVNECKIDNRLTVESLKQKHVFMYWADDRPPSPWKVFRCLNAEIDLNGKKFILSDGAWYNIDANYVAEVNAFYALIPSSQMTLPNYGTRTEPEYLKHVVANSADYALMDRKIIQIGGSRSAVEFCDLYSKSNEIIHVKKYAGSSVLSHLFAQALVSARCFLHEEAFRKTLNQKLPAGFKLTDTKKTPLPKMHPVCLAIMSDKSGELELPFFSKVSIKYVVKELRNLGFEVSKLKINR